MTTTKLGTSKVTGTKEKPATRIEVTNNTAPKSDNSFRVYGEVTKKDDEQRIVYGFASVISKDGEAVVDLQGDVISSEMMERAASQFMLGERNGLTMHKGQPTTTIIHSLPLTNQIKEAFQIETPYEGWIIAVKVHDDKTWQQVKEGRFTGFSIGGKAQRREV